MVYVLNGNRFDFNEMTGELYSLVTPDGNTLISHGAGLFDIAIPVKFDYEILRMTPNFRNAGEVSFEYNDCILKVNYSSLGINMNIPEIPEEIDGGVEAALILKECDDGQSVSMKLKVKNNCAAAVRQIIFPDFNGLNAVTSEAETRFTTMGFTSHPFTELTDRIENRGNFFGSNPAVTGTFYHSGGYFDRCNMIGRYYDYGSLEYGYSLFNKWWGFGPDNYQTMADEVYVKIDQRNHKLRLGGVHYVNLEKDGVYESTEYIFTPHRGGWINGIAPYKAWVDEHKNRITETPKKVRAALGYRTIWIAEQYPLDPDSIKYYFDDLPKVASDMIEHGLIDLSIWGAFDMMLPLGPEHFFDSLGGFEKFKKSADALRAMGIDIVPFVSFVSVWRDTCPRYGLNIGPAQAGWSENLKGIPNFQTPYMERYCCCVIDQSTKLWQEDVMASLRFLRDEAGTPSIGWDQYIGSNVEGGVRDIINEYRRETKEMYPEATFSSESTFNYEADIDALDYTWDWEYWPGTGDCRPYIYVVGTTRPNVIVDNNPLHVKLCFMDNIFMNVYPSKPGDINGSAYIYEYPALSAALKRAAYYRREHLRFFTEGLLTGDCILSRDASGARISAYTYEDTNLLFVLLESDTAALESSLFENRETIGAIDFDSGKRRSFEVIGNSLIISGKTGDLLIIEI